MTNIISSVSNLITHIISTLGYPGVLLLMAVQSAAIPIPSEIILPFAGFLVSTGRFSLFTLALVASVGSAIGSSIGYFFGEVYVKYLPISDKKKQIVHNFFYRFGIPAVLFGQVIPVVRSFISIPAGLAKVRLRIVIIFSFVGTFVWSYLLGWIGSKLGQNWGSLEPYFRKFDIFIVLVILGFGVWWLWRRFSRKSQELT